ncbi:MAG: lytic murein transglycosylase B [Paraglaciecola sp.]|uniref:lytic murein transglycosylase B n=1 Tax=Paraglaciecola sp. TaxID=1920173 RepID=UPI0032645352
MKILIPLILISLFTSFHALSSPETLQQEFIDKMVEKYNFKRSTVEDTLAKVEKNDKILASIAKPWEAKPWHQYYPIFLTEKRLNKGKEFWKKHHKLLERAEQETGVPAQIIVAIIGVETFYGVYKGNYSVLEALVTLGFHYPPRGKFFRRELEQFFMLAEEENFELTEIKGSYAGAMGWGQFISSSYRHYAVDFDKDGTRDLLNSPADAIGSVANYFKKHGWKMGQDIAYKANVDVSDYQPLLKKSLKYEHQWHQLKNANITIGDNELEPDTSVKLFEFKQPNNKEYWVGLKNFYVITRYNHSPLYAMAVFQFSEQLKEEMQF